MGADTSLMANGTIRPFRFVKIDATNDNEAQECDANEEAVGVSAGDTKGFDSDNHAEDGDQVRLQNSTIGESVYVECGGTIASGARVKSDADGKAVASATTGTTEQNSCGTAREDGADGKIIRIVFNPIAHRPALA